MSNFENLQFVNEKVVSTAAIPFIRSRVIQFSAIGLKPYSTVLPFFDGVNVSAYCAPTGGAFGAALVVSGAGTITGNFQIPNDASLKFRTGDRTFALYDTLLNPQTSAQSIYSANGLQLSTQKTFAGNRVVQKIVTRVVDPLAQSFFIDLPVGAFITSIDLFFGPSAATNTESVTVQIRDISSGLPGDSILASTALASTSIVGSLDGFTPTRFTFDSPVFLSEAQDFCFVVLTNSPTLDLWTSTIGKQARKVGDVNSSTGEIISKQPYLGSLFKSQNNVTWTPAQESDIKFQINRAKFNTLGSIVLRNEVEQASMFTESNIFMHPLNFNAFTTVNGSNVVRIKHEDHGFKTGDRVFISKYPQATLTTIGGIPIAQITTGAGLLVTVLDLDTYTVTTTNNATSTGDFGGTYIMFCTQNTVYSEGHVETEQTLVGSTNTNWSIVTKNQANRALTPAQQLSPLTDTLFDQAKVITADKSNELQFVVSMTTGADHLSPIVDVEKAAFIAKSNRIDAAGTISQYVQKQIAITNPANKLIVYIDAYRPAGSDLEVYYKIGQENVVGDWVLLPAVIYPAASQNIDDINEHTFEAAGLTNFFSLQVKVVFKSTNIAKVPVLDNIRTLALMV